MLCDWCGLCRAVGLPNCARFGGCWKAGRDSGFIGEALGGSRSLTMLTGTDGEMRYGLEEVPLPTSDMKESLSYADEAVEAGFDDDDIV